MSIDVMYQGIALARGTKIAVTPSGTFVELEAPMPVGSQLVINEGGRSSQVRVERVHEGVGPGVFVVPVGGALTSTVAPAEAVPETPIEETRAPQPPVEAAKAPQAPVEAAKAPQAPVEAAKADTPPPSVEAERAAAPAVAVEESAGAASPAAIATAGDGQVNDEMPPLDSDDYGEISVEREPSGEREPGGDSNGRRGPGGAPGAGKRKKGRKGPR